MLLQAQALANRDAAAALLHAMRMHRDPSDQAPMPIELHCWDSDARETAATASLAAKAVAAQPAASCVLCGASMPVDTLLQGSIDGVMTATEGCNGRHGLAPSCHCKSWRQGAGSKATDIVPVLLESWNLAVDDADATAKHTSNESAR